MMISKDIKINMNNHLLGYIDLFNQKGYGKPTIKTTEIYTHITSKAFEGLKSPLDELNLNDHENG